MLTLPLEDYAGKRILFLQGPVGPFFRNLAKDFRSYGAQTYHITFNGGGWFFGAKDRIAYRGKHEHWPLFLDDFLTRHKIDVVFLFGERRPVHACVSDLARKHGAELGVFEEGYIRPDYITLERFGVNGRSPLPRNPRFYEKLDITESEAKPVKIRNAFPYAVWWTVLYYVFYVVLKPFFRHHVHHRRVNLAEAGCWIRSVWRKLLYQWTERHYFSRLTQDLSGRYFLCPLQVHNDAQIGYYSDFDCVTEVIREVFQSFSQHAPEDTHLVFKHHPLDRGHRHYGQLIRDLARQADISNRVHYVHDLHLPTLIKHAKGVVLVNSTTGLSVLHHQRPLKVLGEAIYDIAGLSYQGSLHTFWSHPAKGQPKTDLFKRYLAYLVRQSQINGSFYKRCPGANTYAGVFWPVSQDVSSRSASPQRVLKYVTVG